MTILKPGSQSQSAPGAGGEVVNFSTAAQAITGTTRIQMLGSLLKVPASGLKVGSRIRFVFDATKTAAGTATSVFDIAFGILGTIVDTARVSFTKSLGTGVADEGRFVIEALVRSIGSSGVVIGTMTMTHRLAITGLSVLPVQETTVSSGFDNDGQELFISLNATLGASDAYTIQKFTASLSGV